MILNLDLYFLLTLTNILLSFFLIETDECLLLNLILNIASAVVRNYIFNSIVYVYFCDF